MTYLTLSQIDGRIGRLAGRYTALNSDVQEIAVSVVNHANEHGDCSRAAPLCRAVPPRLRNLLIFWFRNVSPINVTIGKTVKDDKCSLRKPDNKLYVPFNLDKAKANNWFDNPFELPEDNVLMTVGTFKERMERLFSSMENSTKEGAGKVNDDDVDTVKAYRSAMREAHISFFKAAGPVTTYDEAPDADEENADPVAAIAAAAAA